MVSTDFSLKIFTTDNCFFICKEKVGSTLLESIYLDSDIQDGLIFNYSINLVEKKITPIFNFNNTIQLQTIDDFQNFLNKTLNKKVILLYRNPIKRLQSSIVEDFSSIINNENNDKFTIDLLFEKFNASEYVMDFVYKSRTSFTSIDFTDEPDEVIHFFEKCLKEYTLYLSKHNFNNQHGENYLHIFYYLLNENFFDLNNLILCNIDESNNFDKLIHKFQLNVNFERKNSKSNFRNIMNNVINDEFIQEKIKHKLEVENLFYELFKLHPNNFN
jgi:hypothetical protein